jgi:hypothetical protein
MWNGRRAAGAFTTIRSGSEHENHGHASPDRRPPPPTPVARVLATPGCGLET